MSSLLDYHTPRLPLPSRGLRKGRLINRSFKHLQVKASNCLLCNQLVLIPAAAPLFSFAGVAVENFSACCLRLVSPEYFSRSSSVISRRYLLLQWPSSSC